MKLSINKTPPTPPDRRKVYQTLINIIAKVFMLKAFFAIH